jgi:hypothetical protein
LPKPKSLLSGRGAQPTCERFRRRWWIRRSVRGDRWSGSACPDETPAAGDHEAEPQQLALFGTPPRKPVKRELPYDKLTKIRDGWRKQDEKDAEKRKRQAEKREKLHKNAQCAFAANSLK